MSVQFLDAIWFVSVALASIAIVQMAILMIRRVFRDRRDARLENRRQDLEFRLILALDGEDSFTGEKLSTGDKLMLSEVAAKMVSSIRGDTVTQLSSTLEKLEIEDDLIASAQSPDVRTRLMSIDGLALLESRNAFDAKWTALADPSHDVRIRAASDIVSSDYAFDTADFIEQLGIGTEVRDRGIRETIIKLAKRDPDGILDAISKTDNVSRRVALIFGLGKTGRYDLVEKLIPLATSESMDERLETIRALATLEHPGARSSVVAALGDERWEVRAQAAFAAGEIGLPEARIRLRELLSDEAWWVRYRAAEALWKMGGESRTLLREKAEEVSQEGQIAQWLIAEKEGEAA